MKHAAALIIVALMALVGLAVVTGLAPRAVEAGLLLADLSAGSQPSLLKRLTARPTRQSVTMAGGIEADLYLPAEKARAGLVLVPGADRSGRTHPRLVALAESLARLRFLVLVPDIASLRDLDVASDDRRPIAEAARWLATERHLPRVGVAAISYALLPAVHAALDEPAVTFVLGIGGAYDLNEAATFFTTGAYREMPGAPWRQASPNTYGKWVFVRSNLKRLDDWSDRALLAAIAERRMADDIAPIDDLLSRLQPQGRAVMALLANSDPDRTPALLAALPPKIKAEMASLDVAGRDLSGLKARLVLIHGNTDRILPWTQSAALARMAPQARLFLPGNLDHAALKPGSILDTVTLWRAATALLEAAGP